jgi:hypothetical protein
MVDAEYIGERLAKEWVCFCLILSRIVPAEVLRAALRTLLDVVEQWVCFCVSTFQPALLSP